MKKKTELIGTLDDRLRTLKEEDLETLLAAAARARSAVSKEEREKELDCKFEIDLRSAIELVDDGDRAAIAPLFGLG